MLRLIKYSPAWHKRKQRVEALLAGRERALQGLRTRVRAAIYNNEQMPSGWREAHFDRMKRAGHALAKARDIQHNWRTGKRLFRGTDIYYWARVHGAT